MSPQRRNRENARLPTGWRWHHGALYYRVPKSQRELFDGKVQFRLGRTEPEAYRVWASRVEQAGRVRTVSEALTRFAAEYVPTLAGATQRSYIAAVGPLRAVFGAMLVGDVRPAHAFEYVDRMAAKQAARVHMEVLSSCLSQCVRWGALDRNPLVGTFRKERGARRERYVHDWEIQACLEVAPPVLRAYVGVKLLTGLRRKDLLELTAANLLDDGIHVVPSKTRRSGRAVIFEWSPELRAHVDLALSLHRGPVRHLQRFVFVKRDGQPYAAGEGVPHAFKSLWQRFIRRALERTALAEPFTEHDLRAKAASDAPSLEHARALLAHSTAQITQRYRRRVERVATLREKHEGRT